MVMLMGSRAPLDMSRLGIVHGSGKPIKLIDSTMRKIIPIGARYPFVTLAINELTVLTNIMNRDAAVNLRK